MTVQIVTADRSAARRAAELLRAGGLVALPTETVYGLAADARNGAALARLFQAKGRPRFNPLIAHVPDLEAAERLAVFDATARRLADAFWPGPLTLVLPRRAGAVHDLTTAGLETLGLRAPDSEITREVLRLVGGPLAMPSANRSGALSPTTAQAAAESLGGAIDLALDAGPCRVGVESTILRVGAAGVFLLRPGGVTLEAAQEAAGVKIEIAAPSERPDSPGQLASHYAPRAGLRLEAREAAPGEAWLGFGAECGPRRDGPTRRNLSPAGDLAEAAANLFEDLRALDAALGGEGAIAVAPIPERGLGRAIQDRLRRATAPR